MASGAQSTRLANKAGVAGGIGVDEAVSAAQRNLGDMRGRIMEEIDRQLATISASTPGLARADLSASAAIVSAADVLTGLCATSDLVPIGEVAREICKLSDALEAPLPFEAVKLLCDTMGLLRKLTDERRAAAWAELRSGLERAVKASMIKVRRKTAVDPSTGLAPPIDGARRAIAPRESR